MASVGRIYQSQIIVIILFLIKSKNKAGYGITTIKKIFVVSSEQQSALSFTPSGRESLD